MLELVASSWLADKHPNWTLETVQGLSREAFKKAFDAMRRYERKSQSCLSAASGLLDQLALPQALGAGGAPEPGPRKGLRARARVTSDSEPDHDPNLKLLNPKSQCLNP